MATPVAVVGLGVRGRQWARAVEAHPALRLAACVEVDERARLAVQGELALRTDQLHADIESALARDDVQAVVVATPPRHHESACRTALERGVAVLVEKPFTLDLATAIDLVELAEARGTPLLVAQSYRYLRAHRAARAIVRSGRLGTIRQITSRHYRSEPDPDIGVDNPTLWDLGVHHLDALRDLLGEDPTAVFASGFDDGSSVQALLEFGGGVRASYSATRRSSGHEFFEGGKEHYLRVVGERGTLHVLQRWLVLCESGRLPRPVRRGRRRQTEEASLLDELAAAIRGVAGAGPTGRDNIGTMAMLDACVRSMADGAWVAPLGAGDVRV
jgi:predicted dehydrogenase